MEILFVTSNQSKFKEAECLLEKNNIAIKQIPMILQEIQTTEQESIVLSKAKQAFALLKKPLIVDDTCLYLEQFSNFPGTLTKQVASDLGCKGILKLVEKKSRKAYFKTLVCYVDENETKIFEGITHGNISKQANEIKDQKMPINSIFIPKGAKKTNSELNEKKEKFSHRIKALKKLSEYLGERIV